MPKTLEAIAELTAAVSTPTRAVDALAEAIASDPGPAESVAPRLLTVQQLADATAINRFLIYDWWRDGVIPGAKQFGKIWRIDRKKAFRYFEISV